MFRPQALLAVVVSSSLLVASTFGASADPVGTVTSAFSARIGATSASVGSTVFVGDYLSTEKTGTIQLRAGAARLMLSGASSASMSQVHGSPAATLLSGTAVFSAANSKSFVLHAAAADIRPKTDEPTVAQVTYVSDKELRVRSNRGALAITVDGETQFVAEGMAYRVILDPDSYYAAMGAQPAADPQGPRGAGTEKHKEPRKAGRSRFLLIAIIITGVATGVALYEAWVSPADP